jgi:hypothetical protein
MAMVAYDIDNLPKVSQEMRDRVAAMTDDEIDYSDMPEITDFSGFVRRSDRKQLKRQKVELIIDQEVSEWLNHIKDVNSVLHEVMILSNLTTKRA